MKPHQKIPMEWMGPPSWRLPSGKALAEFALQAGFVAPLLVGDFALFPRAGRKNEDRRSGAESNLTKAHR